MWRGGLKYRTATAALGEQDFRNIEKWIGSRHLMDFLADEMDGLDVGRKRHTHAFFGSSLLVARRRGTAIIKFPIASLEWPTATIALTIPVTRCSPTVVRATIIAAGRALPGLGIRLGHSFLLAAASGTRPCGS